MTAPSIERRLGWAGWLVATGLVVEIAVSSWVHPLVFVTFLLVAGPLVAAGMLLFLWGIVAGR